MGSNRHIYGPIPGAPGRLIRSYDPVTGLPSVSVDVQGGALKLPSSSLSQKWSIVSADTSTWKDVIELFAEKRPELKEQLPVITGTEAPVELFATLDNSKTADHEPIRLSLPSAHQFSVPTRKATHYYCIVDASITRFPTVDSRASSTAQLR